MSEALLTIAGFGLACVAGEWVGRRWAARQAARPLVHGGMQWWTPCLVRHRLPDGTWSRRRRMDLRLDGRDALIRRVRSTERLTPEGATATIEPDGGNRNGRVVLVEWPDGRAVEVAMGWGAAEELHRAFGG